jgi:hypothetical protein
MAARQWRVADTASRDLRSRQRKIGSGGIADEGEDIEVLELPIDQALAMIGDGRIADAKTIMLLQHAALNIFM